jgi:hypothetical protein
VVPELISVATVQRQCESGLKFDRSVVVSGKISASICSWSTDVAGLSFGCGKTTENFPRQVRVDTRSRRFIEQLHHNIGFKLHI